MENSGNDYTFNRREEQNKKIGVSPPHIPLNSPGVNWRNGRPSLLPVPLMVKNASLENRKSPWHFANCTILTQPNDTDNIFYFLTRKYMHAETIALLTRPLYFTNMKYLK
jgi:hypothetical protein